MMVLKTFLCRSAALSLTAVLLSCGAISVAHAQTLGAAADYNAFFFNDHTAGNSDIEGKVAVGGNANYSGGMTLGGTEPAGNGVTVVVGGNLTENNFSANGSIVTGGDVKWTTPTVNGNVNAKGSVDFSGGGGSINGAINYGTTFTGPGYDINGPANATTQVSPASIVLPVNFVAAQTSLTNKSTIWAGFAQNATNVGGNNITVNLASGVNVLDLTTAQLQSATSFNFTGGANDTLLINIIGSGSVTVPNTGTNFGGGLGTANVIYNFADPGLTSITLNGSFNGSLLAPNANINATSGAFNGQLIAKSGSTGALQFNKSPFKGSFTNTVPEPGTLALAGMLLPLAGLLRRRKITH